MPYRPAEDEMDDSYSEPVTPPDESAAAETESVDEENAEQAQAIVPNSVLTTPDGEAPKEGDEIVVKVVKNYGEESAIIYAPAKPGNSEEEEPSSVEDDMMAMDNEEY